MLGWVGWEGIVYEYVEVDTASHPGTLYMKGPAGSPYGLGVGQERGGLGGGGINLSECKM